MHVGADRNLAGPRDASAEVECICGCGCSEPTTRDESMAGENLLARLQATAQSVVYLQINGGGAPDQ